MTLAAIYKGSNTIELGERAQPTMGSADVRIAVEACGICGTDLHILEGEYESAPPVVLGHEFSGRIIAQGTDVKHLNIGDRVTVEPHVYCGTCKFCVDGREHLCVAKKAFGVHLDGGFSREAVVPARNAYRLPDAVSTSAGALAEPLGCCIHGLDRAAVKLAEHVVVYGAGPIGLILTQLIRRSGCAQLIVVEPDETRRAAALRNGASTVLDPADGAVAIADLTDGYGPDVAFEATGIPRVLNTALDSLGRGGRLVVFGVASPETRVEIEPFRIYREELKILGSLTNPYTHRRAIEMLPFLELDEIISHRFSLQDIHDAFRLASEGGGLKVHVNPTQ